MTAFASVHTVTVAIGVVTAVTATAAKRCVIVVRLLSSALTVFAGEIAFRQMRDHLGKARFRQAVRQQVFDSLQVRDGLI
jgi:hypothetical protein